MSDPNWARVLVRVPSKATAYGVMESPSPIALEAVTVHGRVRITQVLLGTIILWSEDNGLSLGRRVMLPGVHLTVSLLNETDEEVVATLAAHVREGSLHEVDIRELEILHLQKRINELERPETAR
jgi:hypothetical protein